MPQETDPKLFEEKTRQLLELLGHTSSELQYGHKKIDMLLESHRFGKRRLTAVECKSNGKPLSVTEVSTIHAEYLPLLTSNKVDEVLIVTNMGLTAAGEALIHDAPRFAQLTFQELANSVLNLSDYVAGLRALYEDESEGLPAYYVPLRADPGGDLLQTTLKWIEHATQPMAILGAYGSGKSSFARHLAARLAKVAQMDPAARRPILIRLSDISAEQSLEGLIGKTLGATSDVPNYSFVRFMAMNRDGRLVIILDGFDEMKRTLSWTEFRYNLEQLNRLVTPKSRVLLLGRPTAFLNDEEYELALHGRQSYGNGRVVHVNEWPDFLTYDLLPFTPAEIASFLDGYLRYQYVSRGEADGQRTRRSQRSDTAINKRLEAKIQHQIERVQQAHLKEIAKRPVQLKMLAEVLPSWKGSIDRLDTTLLFDNFIDRIIERDAAKVTRSRFDIEQRRAFATELAWWLWTSPATTRAMPDDVPDEIIDRFCDKGENRNAVRRDLVAACFLDRSHGGPLVFPHRSFQEFLVACHALDALATGDGQIGDIDAVLNREIADFMCDMSGTSELKKIDKQLADYRGAMSYKFARMWFSTPHKAEWLNTSWRTSINPWHILFVTLAMQSGTLSPKECRSTDLLAMLGGEMEARLALLIWRCIIQLARVNEDGDTVEAALNRLMTVGKQVHAREHQAKIDIPFRSKRPPNTTAQYLRPDTTIASVLKAVTFRAGSKTMDLRGTYKLVATQLSSYCWVRNAKADDGLPWGPVALGDNKLIERVRAYTRAV